MGLLDRDLLGSSLGALPESCFRVRLDNPLKGALGLLSVRSICSS
jgi:hypothetical protein